MFADGEPRPSGVYACKQARKIVFGDEIEIQDRLVCLVGAWMFQLSQSPNS